MKCQTVYIYIYVLRDKCEVVEKDFRGHDNKTKDTNLISFDYSFIYNQHLPYIHFLMQYIYKLLIPVMSQNHRKRIYSVPCC